ncbi:MAG: ATP-binding cassette domain-containing protein [Chloroflexota bacterium]|nr:ATP-binding cassette domain-containing protein [Dehalococcoidia bacterium]MDW8253420.1 ATP-binding cassette domain-containing protein [Chloroflexota bacterium]
MAPYIVAEGLFKIYQVADLEVVALQGLDLTIERGELVAIVGASGSGKSTLLNILGGLDLPSAGRVLVGGKDLTKLPERDLVRYRREEVGFLWQQPSRNLLPYLTAAQNVEVPLRLAGVSAPERRRQRDALLAAVGLAEKASHKPDQLSGGEQQRVATAVALALDPPLLLADEPTGELDSETAADVLRLFRSLCRERGVTIVLVTHDPDVAALVDRVVRIRDGRVSSEAVAGAADEFVVIDSAGRLQLPAALRDQYRLVGRARVAAAGDHVGIWPVHPA